MARYSKSDIAEATESLKRWLKPGDTVYLVLRHVSRSGMRRTIGVLIPRKDGNPLDFIHPNYSVACVLGYRAAIADRDGVIVDGAGMDMGFHLVSSLAQALFGDGYALKRRRG